MDSSFNSDFWVAVATVASVVFLANAVLITQVLQDLRPSRMALTAYLFSGVAAIVCSLETSLALTWLGGRSGHGAVVFVIGISLALTCSILAAIFAGMSDRRG